MLPDSYVHLTSEPEVFDEADMDSLQIQSFCSDECYRVVRIIDNKMTLLADDTIKVTNRAETIDIRLQVN